MLLAVGAMHKQPCNCISVFNITRFLDSSQMATHLRYSRVVFALNRSSFSRAVFQNGLTLIFIERTMLYIG
jgi:hypothetical protein